MVDGTLIARPERSLLARLKKFFASAKNDKKQKAARLYNLDYQDHHHWDERAASAIAVLAEVVKARPVTTIADVGCGAGKIESLLRIGGIDAAYTGLDLLPQNAGVRQFDITHDDLPQAFDAAMILGVLEYVDDVTAVLARHRPKIGLMVVSHAIKEARPGMTADKQEKLGWRTFLTSAEFEQRLAGAGYTVERSVLTPDQNTRIWLCS